MPSRTKVNTRSGKKATKHKKPIKKKKQLTAGIGVISTIKMPQAWKLVFESGVNNAGVTIKYKLSVGYDKNKLKTEIQKFNADTTIGLIVTVGGLLAYGAANSFATKPFISLIGGTPPSPSAKFYGGVSLESYRSNPARITYLGGKGYSSGQICLFFNPSSGMEPAETQSWGGATPVPGDPSTYAADFLKIPATVTAVVISADASFQDTKDQLIPVANGSNKYICYPLQDYENVGGTQPTAHRATLYGPSLKDPYNLLGQRAAIVLNTSAPLSPLLLSVPDIIKDL